MKCVFVYLFVDDSRIHQNCPLYSTEISRRHWIIDTDGIHIHPKPAESQRTCMLDSLKESESM